MKTARVPRKQYQKIQNLACFPAELLIHICAVADPIDLTTFRQVCRKFKDAAVTSFGKAFFTDRMHLISAHSLEQLVEMSANPDFGPYIRRLGFKSVLLPYPHHLHDIVIMMNVRNLDRLRTSNNNQVEFLKDGSFCRQLTLVFENLKAWRHPVTLHVDCSYPPFRGWGWSYLWQGDDLTCEAGNSPPSNIDTFMNETAMSYRDAIRATSYPVDGLMLDFPAKFGGPFEILYLMNPFLRLAARGRNEYIPGGVLNDRFFHHRSLDPCGLMRYAEGEKSLELDLGFLNGAGLVGLTGWLSPNTLRKLVIKNTCTRWETGLEAILERNSDLRHLECNTVHFSDSWMWSATFAAVSDKLKRLEYCRFTNLRYEQFNLAKYNDELLTACREVLEFRGQTDVCWGLANLHARFKSLEEKFADQPAWLMNGDEGTERDQASEAESE